MKSKICFLMLIIFPLGLASCESGNKTTDKPESLILKLYEVHQPQKGKEIAFDDDKTLGRYFTQELTALFLRNEECVKRTHEVCNLDMDPIFDAQDYDDSPLNLEVKEISSKQSILRFSVTLTNLGRRTLIYEMSKTKSGWRISDIVYPSKNRLTELLSQPE